MNRNLIGLFAVVPERVSATSNWYALEKNVVHEVVGRAFAKRNGSGIWSCVVTLLWSINSF